MTNPVEVIDTILLHELETNKEIFVNPKDITQLDRISGGVKLVVNGVKLSVQGTVNRIFMEIWKPVS